MNEGNDMGASLGNADQQRRMCVAELMDANPEVFGTHQARHSDATLAQLEETKAAYARVMREFFARLGVSEESAQELGNDRVINIGDVAVGFRLAQASRLIDIYIGLDLPDTLPLNEAHVHLLKQQTKMQAPFHRIYGVHPETNALVMRTYVSLDEVNAHPDEFVLHVKMLVASIPSIWS